MIRNIGIVTQLEQEKFSNTSVAVVGVGMGSAIAEQLVRFGVKKLLIVDGDEVAESNLNRQIFIKSDIGRLKVEAVRDRLLQINPELEIAVVPKFLGENNLHLLSDYQLIIDTIDLSAYEVINSLHEWAISKGKKVIFPINLGWKSIVFIFTEESKQLSEMLPITVEQTQGGDFEKWAIFLAGFVPDYGMQRYTEFLEKAKSMKDWCPAPQIVSTVQLGASLVTTLAVKIANDQAFRVAPDFYELDTFAA
jgi:molybdopterin/thiamine biosynthesis adenylyltransferase